MSRDQPDFAEWFWAKADRREPDECWPWIKGLSDGYGRVGFEGRLHLAHRIAYELEVGPIPDGLLLDHTCHNADLECPGGPLCMHRKCVNPKHLDPATFADNIRRGRSYNGSLTHCRRGHEYTPENTIIQKGKYRSCKKCTRMKQAEHRAKRRKERELS